MRTFDNNPNKSVSQLSYDIYYQYLTYYANFFMKQQGNYNPYVVDDNNKDIIKNLFYWINRSPQGEYDFNKGIMLCGKIGCGKTLLMRAFLEVLMAASGYFIQSFQASLLHVHYQRFGIDSLKSCPIFIDELGREQLEIYVNGVRIRPIEDLIAMRYEYNPVTFYTSNFKIETLSQGYDENGKKIGYGAYIGDRIKEKTNIIIMPGGSRRV